MNTAATAVAADPPGFASLVETYRRELYRYAYRLSGNVHTAEDLVQEALLRAWRSRTQVARQEAIKAWLYTIVRRENARRFQRVKAPESDLPVEEVPAAVAAYDTSTEAFALRRVLRDLPAEYREPLILQVLHGYTQQEIAERLGLSSAGAGTRLFRARQKLRAALGER